jgi:hypothetical protein
MDNNIDDFRDEFLHLYFDEQDLQEHIDDKTTELENLSEEITLFRVVFLKKEDDLNVEELGNHWVEDVSVLDSSLLKYLQHESSGETIEGEPFLIEAKFNSDSVNKELSLHQYLYNPNEEELYIRNGEKPVSDIIFQNFKTLEIIDIKKGINDFVKNITKSPTKKSKNKKTII